MKFLLIVGTLLGGWAAADAHDRHLYGWMTIFIIGALATAGCYAELCRIDDLFDE